MTVEQIQPKIGKLVKIFFSKHDERFPIIGIFVNLKDANELSSKGMIRFVSQSRLDHWDSENPSVGLTRIFVASDITQVTKVDNSAFYRQYL
jgi:hypothetical protein